MTRVLRRIRSLENTHYDTLGCSPGATEEQLHSAYLELAFHLHPDREGGDEAKFKVIAAAWGVLKNKEFRAAYDKKLALESRLNCGRCQGLGLRSGFTNGKYERNIRCEACKGKGYI